MTDEYAFSTDNPETLAAYRQAVTARAEQGRRIAADVKALGAGPQVFVRTGGFGDTPQRMTAIEQNGDFIPEGWRVVRGNLEPRLGKPGEAARKWLADHQPVDVRHAMTAHGLPRVSWVAREKEFGWRLVTPKLFEHACTLWACYEGEPGRGESGFDTERCTWTPRKLSEFHAVWESVEDAKASVKAGA